MQYRRPDGTLLQAMPRVIKLCKLCHQDMFVSEGQIAYYHGCCRKFRGDFMALRDHIEKKHTD